MSSPQQPLLTYLGPPGSFTHAAVELLSAPWAGPIAPRTTVSEVIFAVESGEADAGVVPLETSVEGDVSSTVDELIFRSSMCFINEVVVVPVSYLVAGVPGSRLGGISRLVTTSVARTQCRRFLEASEIPTELVGDVDEAAAVAAADDSGSTAALTTTMSAHLNSLAVLRTNVEDQSGVATRMAKISRRIPAATGHDETALVVTPIGDRTGVLADILRCFSDRGIALTSISSRPLKTRLGEYSFLLTALSHLSDSRLQSALQATADLPAEVKILGSFPFLGHDDRHRVDESAPPGSVGSAGLASWIDTILTPERLGL